VENVTDEYSYQVRKHGDYLIIKETRKKNFFDLSNNVRYAYFFMNVTPTQMK